MLLMVIHSVRWSTSTTGAPLGAFAVTRWAPSLATREYNLKVAPLAAYVAQVTAPVQALTVAGRRAATRLFHLPHSALPASAWRRLDDFGLLQPRMIDIAARAALIAMCARRRAVRQPALLRLDHAAAEGAGRAASTERSATRGWRACDSTTSLRLGPTRSVHYSQRDVTSWVGVNMRSFAPTCGARWYDSSRSTASLEHSTATVRTA